MKKETFRVAGRVVDKITGRGVPGLRVEVWDREQRIGDPVGREFTREKGEFRIEAAAPGFQELFFRVFRGSVLLASTEDTVIWSRSEPREVRIEVQFPAEVEEDADRAPPSRHRDECREEREEHEFEVEQLRRHEAWFDPERWTLGMAQKRRMPRAALKTPDPGPQVLAQERGPGVFVAAEGAQRVAVRQTDAPEGSVSFGFVGAFAVVESAESFLRGTLVLRFDPERLGSVVRRSLRLFYWDEDVGNFTLVAGSRVSSAGDYVYAPVTRPGRYGIVGVSGDPLVLSATRLICESGTFRSVLPEVTRRLIDPICTVILCAPELREALGNPRIEQALLLQGAERGFPGPPGGLPPVPPGSGEDLCKRCLGTGRIRLPECEIIEPPLGGPLACVSVWESVGPADLSGCIKQVHVDPTDSNRLYCAAMNGGVWVLDRVSHYPGHAWRPLTDQLESLRTNVIAVAPGAADVLYAASPYVCIFRSDDRGANWRPLEATRGWKVHRILVHPADAETLYAATENGLRISTDGGGSWTLLRNGDVLDAAFDPLDSSILYLGVRWEGVLKSVTSGFGPWTTVLPWSRAASPAGTEILVALGYRNADGSLQTDASRTVVAKLGLELFVNRRGGRAASGGWVSKGNRGRADQLWWDNVLAVDPFDPDVFLTGEQELYRTADGGDSWSTVASYYAPHEDQQSVEFDRANQGVVYLSNDGGVFRSTDGGRTWYVSPNPAATEIAAQRSLVKDLVTAEFYTVGVQFDTSVGNLYHSGIIASTDLATSLWSGIEGHAWEFAQVFPDPRRPGRFYVYHTKLARRRFPGLGSNDFVDFGEFRPYASVGSLAVDVRSGSGVILVCAHPDTAAGTGYRLMMTTEGDREPRSLPDGTVADQPAWTAVIDSASPLTAVSFGPGEARRAYAMAANGQVFRKDDIDAPGAWSQPGWWMVDGIRQVAVNPLHADRVYAITANRFGRSPDGGANWTEHGAASLPASEFNSLIAHPTIATTLYLGADIGVFVSTDEGDNWAPFDDDLPNAEVLQIFAARNYLYAVTHGRGLWRRRLC